ncbi:MAG: hypothetical protein IJH86_00365 [Clostridia bacterium]|nr:hypothetical protein [Clostridia bacterium]
MLAILLTLILAAPCGLAESPSPNGAGPETALAEAFDLSEDTVEVGVTPAGPEAVTFELSELAAAPAGLDTDAPAVEAGAVPAKWEADAPDEAITAAPLEDDVPEAGSCCWATTMRPRRTARLSRTMCPRWIMCPRRTMCPRRMMRQRRMMCKQLMMCQRRIMCPRKKMPTPP